MERDDAEPPAGLQRARRRQARLQFGRALVHRDADRLERASGRMDLRAPAYAEDFSIIRPVPGCA
jgi:hypothetical protein